MANKNVIIAFANQKGGCGKSTLCTLLANYLNWKKKSVCVVDTDTQQSLVRQREEESKVYGEDPYTIQGFKMTSPDLMQQLMGNIKDVEGYVLIDTPGRLTDDGIIPILLQSDYIICPVQYDIKSLNSTYEFIKSFRNLQEMYNDNTAKLIFIPNNSKRKGSLEEKQAWQNVVNSYSVVGTVLDTIPYRSNLERVNTFEINNSQIEVIKKTFDKLIKITKQ